LCINNQLTNFQGGYPRKHSWGRGGGRHNSYGPGKYNQKKTGGTTSEKKGQMTSISRQCVNITCTNFNEFCQAYPCINTSSYTNRSLKGADNPDGLAHKQSKSGRETLPLCSQLGTDHPRPLGLAGNHGVPTRTYPDPTPGQTES